MSDPFPWHLVLVFELLHVSLSYPTNRNYVRKWILAPSMVALAVYLWTQTPPIPDPLAAYVLGFNMSFRLVYMANLVYAHSDFPDYWRRLQDGDQLPSTLGLKKKLTWMFDSAYGFRRLGWVQEPKGVLPKSFEFDSRLAFIAYGIAYSIVNIVLLECMVSYQVGNPAFDPSVHPSIEAHEAYLRSQSPISHLLIVLSWALALISGARAQHMPYIILTVALGTYEPRDWKDFLGSFADAYTVRRMWGRSWHQTLRVTISGVGKQISNGVFRFTPGTRASAYTQLYIAFFLSGFIHVGSDYMVLRTLSFSPTMKFFILQPIVITIEDIFLWATRSIRPKLGWLNRAIGYVWVIGWGVWSFSIWLDSMSVHGYTVAGTMWKQNSDLTRQAVRHFLGRDI